MLFFSGPLPSKQTRFPLPQKNNTRRNSSPEFLDKESPTMTPQTFFARYRALPVLALVAMLMLAISFSKDFSSNAQKMSSEDALMAGAITGRVFQDFNGNGNFETTTTIANAGFGTIGVAIDRGVAGIEVRAYDSTGANVTPGGVVLTDTSGNYSLTTTDAGSGPYRVEFTNLAAGYSPSARSTDSVSGGTSSNSGSTVQFVSTPVSNVNLAINYPSDYSQNNPEIVASKYADGNQLGGNVAPVLISFPYSAGSADTTAGASETAYDAPTTWPLSLEANEVGTTFGLAYARRTGRVYAGAFFKRHAGFGPGGPNAIYNINRTGTGSVASTFTVSGTATNAHDTSDYPHDNNNTGWAGVGTTSLGGMALSEDESTLYVVNLADRTLRSLNATTGAQIASQSTPVNLPLAAPLSGNCAAADARPFALTMYHGVLYAGMICSAQSTGNVDTFTDSNSNGVWDAGDYFLDADLDGVHDSGESYYELTSNGTYTAPETFTDGDGNGVYNIGDARALRAYVYTVNPTTLAFGSSPVFETTLNYKRGMATKSQSANGAWRPWSATYRSSMAGTRVVYAQPMLTDIAFDNGNMILGLRDRVSDQVGNGSLSNPGDASMTNFYQPRTSGDVIRACGTPNSWTLENNGRCGGTGTATQSVSEGPGGGEFYFGDAYDLSADFVSPGVTIMGKGGNHDDTGNGGVEQLPGAPDVVISNFDPIANIGNMIHDGGLRWLSNSTGAFTKGYRLYDGDTNDNGTFGKAGGIGGSLVMLSNPAPLEIGNRVWRDTNNNGVQNAGENGIANVTVRLYQGSSLVGTAVTDSNGEYYFVAGSGADPIPTDNVGQVNGGLLYSTAYQVRFDNASNYSSGGPLFGLTLTTVNQTSQAGDDDSSDSDANSVLNPSGSPAPGVFPVISVTTGGPGSNDHRFDVGFALIPSAADVSVQGRVSLQAGNGIRNVNMYLTEQNGTIHHVVTSSFGYYHFDNIEAGQTVIVSLGSKRFTFNPSVRVVSLQDSVADLDFIADQ